MGLPVEMLATRTAPPFRGPPRLPKNISDGSHGPTMEIVADGLATPLTGVPRIVLSDGQTDGHQPFHK